MGVLQCLITMYGSSNISKFVLHRGEMTRIE